MWLRVGACGAVFLERGSELSGPYSRGISLSTRYSNSLRTGRSGDRISVGTSYSAPVQTGPGAYPASCTVGTESFLGVKRPGRGVVHPPLCSPEVKERVELYLCFTSGPLWPVLG